MPDSETVNFFLSLSGSNPISYPSGIVTFLSMIALRILACLPTLQLYIIIESVPFGLNYETPFKGLSLSTVIRNIGSMNALRNKETQLPTDFRLGSAYKFGVESAKLDFIAVAEFQNYLNTDDIHFNLGGDIVYDQIIALRVGYQSGYETKSFTGGIGLMWGSLRFDYTYMPFSFNLGNANLFSLQFKF